MDRPRNIPTICPMNTYHNALVVGYGRSGRAAEALLHREGCTVYSISQETTPNYRFEDLHFQPDVAIISPGFSLTHPWISDLTQRGIPLLSELELGWSYRQCPVIAVTGSNGKSTVVKWIVESLEKAGQRAVPCGNYGFPVCDAVMLPTTPDWLVIEVSSFQLETIRDFRPDIGLLLNVLPNHLDRHGNMETYRNLKLRMFEKMQPSDTAILSYDLLLEIGKSVSKGWKTFGTAAEADFIYQEGRIGDINLNGTRFANEILGAAGAAVAAVCTSCGIPTSAVEEAARAFEPLPHRTAWVAEVNGVHYVDDSKATNLAAMCAAIKMFTGPLHLIVGGRAKERDFSLAKDLLAQRVSQLYVIGEASGVMQAAWGDTIRCNSCGTLEQAVIAAHQQAKSGETVLFSPACTSFDQFRDFNERGDCFVAAVNRLITNNING